MSTPIPTTGSTVPSDQAVRGLHHLTAISTDAGRSIAWYTGILGLRLVTRSVDPDDWRAHHLFFSTGTDGAPGSLLTVIDWPTMKRGTPGIGGTHHIAFATADRDTLLRWKRWLTDHGQPVEGPYDRTYFTSIYTKDPDGLIIEIATNGPGWTIDEAPDALGTAVRPPPFETTAAGRDEPAIAAETWPEPVPAIDDAMRLEHFHHVTAIGTHQPEMERLWTDLLGLRMVKRTLNFDDPTSPHLYWGVGEAAPGTIVTFFVQDPNTRRPARSGTGVTHHWALDVPDGSLDFWVERLTNAGHLMTPIQDRAAFQRVAFRDRDGMIVELATSGPGLTAVGAVSPASSATDPASLPLWLPEQIEAHRATIEGDLSALVIPDIASFGTGTAS